MIELAYRLVNLRHRVSARAVRQEVYRRLGVGLTADLEVEVLRYARFRDLALDQRRFDLLALHAMARDAERRRDPVSHVLFRDLFAAVAGSAVMRPAIERLGVVSRRVVTDAGVGFLTDAFQNITEIELMNFHASGTGAVAEAVGDTALGAEVEARETGTQSEPAANQYRSVATHTYAAAFAITEHGIFNQLVVAGSVLWDRSVFAAINVGNGDSIQFTYTLTSNSGG